MSGRSGPDQSSDHDSPTAQARAHPAPDAAIADARRFRALLDHHTNVTTVADARGNVQYVSASITKMLGYTPEEFSGVNAFAALHPEDAPHVQAFLGEIAATPGGTSTTEYRVRHKDGSWRWVEATMTNLLADPDVRGVVGCLHDITERRRTEEILRETSRAAEVRVQELEATFQALVDGVIIYDTAGRKVRENRAARVIFGLDAQPDYDSLPIAERGARLYLRDGKDNSLQTEDIPALRVLRGETLMGGTTVDMRFIALDGRAVDVNVTGTPLRDATGAIVGAVCVYRDVTERRSLERTVAAERDRLQQVLDVLPVAILIVDTTPRTIVGNQTATALFGDTVDTEQTPTHALLPDARFGAHRTDGTLIPIDELPLSRALRQGEHVRGEQLVVRAAADDAEITLLANAAPLFNNRGDQVGAVGVFQDISDLRDLERTREEFASAAAHDLKTPLTTIQGNAQLARRRLARLTGVDVAPVAMQLERIEAAAGRMVRLINEMVDVTRLQLGAALTLERTATDLVALVQSVVTQQPAAAAARIHVDTTETALIADVDMLRIERVISNLLSNALKYSPEPRPITIRVTREDGPTGPEAVITVTDRGIGIPEADLPHIFERFRRAGNVVGHIQGTGIGLASARQIVEQHGGTIAATSVEGIGSTFTVCLPLISSDD